MQVLIETWKKGNSTAVLTVTEPAAGEENPVDSEQSAQLQIDGEVVASPRWWAAPSLRIDLEESGWRPTTA